VGVQLEHAFRSLTGGALGGGSEAFLSQEVHSCIHVAIRLLKGFAAIQETGASGFAEGFDHFGRNSHVCSSIFFILPERHCSFQLQERV
jgi:hypothetical protein